MANICKASTENDKHAIAEIPTHLPALMPSCISTSHPFFWATTQPGFASTTNPVTTSNAMRLNNCDYGCSRSFLTLNLNNPFKIIDKAFQTDLVQTTDAAIFSGTGTTKYHPQNLMFYQGLFKYYKVDSVVFSVTIRNVAGMDTEEPCIPCKIFAYHQNNESDIPGLDNYKVTTDLTQNRVEAAKVAALMMNPRVKPVAKGAILGSAGQAGFTGGLVDATVTLPYNESVVAHVKFDNNSSVASDPNIDTNIKYWTLSDVSATPVNVQKLHFFVVPCGVTSRTETFGHFRPQIEIKAMYNITWRDHTATDAVYTTLTR